MPIFNYDRFVEYVGRIRIFSSAAQIHFASLTHTVYVMMLSLAVSRHKLLEFSPKHLG